ncbi:MAG: hypothetical protein ACFFB3_14970 [Candidatus Hodarchaeota archaeon]
MPGISFTNFSLAPEEFLLLVSWMSVGDFLVYTVWLIAISIPYLRFWRYLFNFWETGRDQGAIETLEDSPKSYDVGRAAKAFAFCVGLPLMIIGGLAFLILSYFIGFSWVYFLDLLLGTAESPDLSGSSFVWLFMIWLSLIAGILGFIAFAGLTMGFSSFKYVTKNPR